MPFKNHVLRWKVGLKCYVAGQLYNVIQKVLERQTRNSVLDFKAKIEACEEMVEQDFVLTVLAKFSETLIEENDCPLYQRVFCIEKFFTRL